ncbi:ornithine cyclodeaminase family protein [Pigmentiphaga soli]|uniref:Ornithine cyclodeaminase family protein n=1 Tax=Pigmentiphaga soli TaxID=1007095 RepID=A0ABP8GBF4_9BURK
MRLAFSLHSQGSGRVFPLIREHLHTGGVFGIKAGDIAGDNVLGFKAAGFWPGNRELGSEPHQATVMLFDPATGRPLCLMDGNAITAERTGAAGGIGLQELARPDSGSLCVFGTGVQARVQLRYALKVLPGIRHVRYVSANGQPDLAFEAAFHGKCELRLAANRDEAVAASDVVITATTGGGALFSLDAVRPGTHLNCVGSDTAGKRELPPGLLARARVVVDDLAQSRSVGECQWASGTECTEMGSLIAKQHKPLRKDDEITVFDMTGIALQDLTVARTLYEGARARGQGTSVAWPW